MANSPYHLQIDGSSIAEISSLFFSPASILTAAIVHRALSIFSIGLSVQRTVYARY